MDVILWNDPIRDKLQRIIKSLLNNYQKENPNDILGFCYRYFQSLLDDRSSYYGMSENQESVSSDDRLTPACDDSIEKVPTLQGSRSLPILNEDVSSKSLQLHKTSLSFSIEKEPALQESSRLPILNDDISTKGLKLFEISSSYRQASTEPQVGYSNVDDPVLHIGDQMRMTFGHKDTISGFSCDALFSSQSFLELHERTHPHMVPDLKYKCSRCQFSTNKKSHPQRHTLTHTGEKPYKCLTCEKSFTVKRSLEDHLLVHKGEKLHRCPICNRTFLLKKYLQRHKKVHTAELPYRCRTCGVDFPRKEELKRHELIYHVKTKMCQLCNFRAADSSAIQSHMERMHTLETPQKCPDCDFVATRKSLLRQHSTRAHVEKKTYACPHCEYKATTTSRLKEHITRKHTQDFKHRCSFCGRGFMRPGVLGKHKEIVHQTKKKDEDIKEII